MILWAILAVETVGMLALGIYCLSLRVRASSLDGMIEALIAERDCRRMAEGRLRVGRLE